MAIAARAQRKTEFYVSGTPETVGPGAYVPETKAARPNFTGFATSGTRAKFVEKESKHIPGPGAYTPQVDLSIETQKQTNVRGMNAFSSKAPRIAPIYSGSTVFRASSSVENPGPGSYIAPSSFNPKRSAPRPRHTRNKELLVQYQAHPPAIPTRDQAYGYTEEVDAGRIVLSSLPRPAELYSGVGQDTVGPADYQPNIEAVKRKLAANINLKNASAKKSIFDTEPARQRNAIKSGLPVPNQFFNLAASHVNPEDRQEPAPVEQTPSSFFRSTSKRTDLAARSESVGPGAYLGAGGKSYSMQEEEEEQGVYVDIPRPGFGTGEARRSPWEGPDKLSPGPGSYRRPPSDFDYKMAARLTYSRHVGFTSSEKRPWLKENSEERQAHSAPGPGQYDVDRVNGMAEMARKRTVGRNGVFGTTTKRFDKRPQQLPVGFAEDDVQNSFSGIIDASIARNPTRSNGKLLPSSLARFHRRDEIPEFPAGGSLVNDVPGVGAYVPELADDLTRPTPSKSGAGTSFRSTAKRFDDKHILGVPIKNTPGPAAYGRVFEPRRVAPKGSRATVLSNLSSGARVVVPPKDDVLAAPGSYDTSSSMLKKSFNITYSKMKPGAISLPRR